MNLQLEKLTLNKKDPAIVHITIDATYSWNEKNFHDHIRIQYNRRDHDVYLALKITHPGVGAVISRIADTLSRITNYQDIKLDPVLIILEQLNHELGLEYDSVYAESLLTDKPL